MANTQTIKEEIDGNGTKGLGQLSELSDSTERKGWKRTCWTGNGWGWTAEHPEWANGFSFIGLVHPHSYSDHFTQNGPRGKPYSSSHREISFVPFMYLCKWKMKSKSAHKITAIGFIWNGISLVWHLKIKNREKGKSHLSSWRALNKRVSTFSAKKGKLGEY